MGGGKLLTRFGEVVCLSGLPQVSWPHRFVIVLFVLRAAIVLCHTAAGYRIALQLLGPAALTLHAEDAEGQR